MTSLYALLVGIDRYDERSQISPLRGCANDIKAMNAYLQERAANVQLQVRTLINEQATRQAIIDGFREHLQQAEAGDTVLFYYAGHGSQDKAPEEFWTIDPDKFNETLVCYDSRTEGVWDLTDKELAKLISEVSDRNPHITVVLDCCHSGSGTRSLGVSGGPSGTQTKFAKRRAPIDLRDRPPSSFIVSPVEMSINIQQQENKRGLGTRSSSSNTSQSGWQMPQGRHVLMAACRDSEEASEYSANNLYCGAFSHFLLSTLQKAKSELTYRDLFDTTHSKLCAQISDQSPQLEATFLEDLNQPFLGNVTNQFSTYSTVNYFTTQPVTTMTKSQANARISKEKAVTIANTKSQDDSIVVIQPHSQFKAIAQLTASAGPTAPATRSLSRTTSTPTLTPTLIEQTQPLITSSRRGTASELGTLELSEIENAESVTPKCPLKLLVNTPIAADETVLPLAYDGEFFVPLGYGHSKGEQTEVVLQHLPRLSDKASDEAAVSTRSLSGSFKIFFRKVAKQTLGDTLSQKIGLSFDYPILAAVESISKEDKKVSYLADTEKIKKLVSKAKNIAIYIHGITGDTQSLVPSIQTARVNVDGQSKALEDVYDLVLTYDYESINTSIAETAAMLKQRLAAVGIVPGHNKTVHIVAHSMGGLVSRWLIEKDRGNDLIDHLIMLGTPNAGSPWPLVQAGLTKSLCFAINGLTPVAWPLSLIGGVLGALETIDVALDEMEPDSNTLALLAASEPSMAYSIVAGNMALIDEKTDLRSRLQKKLDQISALAFPNENHDTAVSVRSIKQVPAGRAGMHQVREVGCDHAGYFIDPVGLSGLSWAVEQAFGKSVS